MKITAVRGWYPLDDRRAFKISRSYAYDFEEAVVVEHACDSPCCDICHAREAGFARVAADLLSSAFELLLLAAVVRAHRFNGTAENGQIDSAAEWQEWLGYWTQAEDEGRLWQCLACEVWNWDSRHCGACSADRPVWKLVHTAYSGMVTLRETYEDRDDARTHAATRILAARAHGYPVETRQRGREWEILEPPDCCLVPDGCGLLTLDLTSP